MEEDIVKISIMLDIYGNLLTEKQKNTLENYYNLDLSLAEIAQAEGISRQAVLDNIQKGKEKLYSFEEALGLYKKQKKMIKDINNIILELEDISKSGSCDNLFNVIEKLKDLKKD